MKFEKISREDWISSLVVFIVAMPLSLGIALASGASPAAGLITAVIGGVVAGLLAGAPLTVTGPAAGMTALVFQLVMEYGMNGLAVITVLAGLLQIVLGLVRAGKVFAAIPHAVLEGVLSAIGILIVVGQIHVLCGGKIPTSVFDGILRLPEALVQISPIMFCGLFAIAIQILWNKGHIGFKWIPGALPAVIMVTLLSQFWTMPRVELEPLLPIVQNQLGIFAEMSWVKQIGTYLFPAIGVAVVASAESLLTARAVDTLVEGRPGFKPAKLNQELAAQGAANIASGALGGIPMTAVMVRSAANVNSGGKTRWSTVFHGIWIAVFVGLVPELISKIPLTALAAVLILTGYKLINFQKMLYEIKHHKKEGLLWLSTALFVLGTDLLTGLMLALILAAILNAKRILASFRLAKGTDQTCC